MLKQIIDAARLKPEFCAGLVHVPIEQFRRWMDGQLPIPAFVIPEICSILGVTEQNLTSPVRQIDDRGSIAPAVWFKLRENLADADREVVALIRRLGFFSAQLETARGVPTSASWRAIARTVLEQVDRSAPPTLQGRQAAMSFRAAALLDKGMTGIGDVLRKRLREIGLLVIESPIPRSSLEGFCLAIGPEADPRPCVFANTFKSTWFRRNDVLLHEVCHAIFDIENDQISIDLLDSHDVTAMSEVRASAFARETLVPEPVLRHYENQIGIKWDRLKVSDIAELMAHTHVEQATLLGAAFQGGFISASQRSRYLDLDCAEALKAISKHALSTREYLDQEEGGPESRNWIAANRTTTVGQRRLLLPVGYVKQVIDTLMSGDISRGKAAEFLMIDRYTFEERFGGQIAETCPA